MSSQRVWEPRAWETLRRCCSAWFRVVLVAQQQEHDVGGREVVVEGVVDEQACPDCGVLSRSVHSRKLRRVKDLPHGRPLWRVWWDQRRWACRERHCRRRTSAETSR